MATIYINQSGYITDGTKRAVLVNPARTFDIIDESGATVFSGNVKHFGNDEYSGDDVYTADFSEFASDWVNFVFTTFYNHFKYILKFFHGHSVKKLISVNLFFPVFYLIRKILFLK